MLFIHNIVAKDAQGSLGWKNPEEEKLGHAAQQGQLEASQYWR